MNTQKFTSIKKILIVALLSIYTSHSFAQSSNGIFFQAVARDNFSNPAKDRNIYVQSTIIQNTTTGTKVLIEVHKSSTDAMGVFNITIGNGQRSGGSATSIAAIDWSKGPFYLNLKIAITPFSASDNWDYSKELVDMGTTSFGAVPFAFYSASSAKVDDKLNANDTTKMLAVYAKAMSVKILETSLATKLTAADTLTMLAPYAKAAYTIDSSFFKTQLATKLSIADSSKYVTSSQLASYNFSGGGGVTVDTSNLSKRINLKANATEITILTATLTNKLNIADSTKYVTPTQLSSYNFSGGGGTTIDTTSLSNRINLKANTADVASAIAASTSSINTNTTAITAEAATARAAELALSNSIANNTSNIATNTTAIANLNSLNTNIASNTASITSLTSFVLGQVATSSASELTITNNLTANTASINALNTNVASSTSSITSNTTSINNLNTNVVSNISSINSLNTTIAAATYSNTANTIVKRDDSGNFSTGTINATSINTPIYASAPQTLIAGATISWNPTNGLNASVTLNQNSTLSFSSLPIAGSYGTLVVTQDVTGGRTLTLPSTANKVLGSSSSTTIALSTAASSKDILNFYYDGTNCYWNIGQGYGSAATAPLTLTTTGSGAATLSGTTLNIPLASSTVNAGSISGTIAVANGGTGQSTISAIQSVLGLAGTKVAIGATSGQTNQGAGAVAIGNATGNSNQGSQSVAIGYVAGQANQGANSVAIGSNAAQGGQGTQSVAVGIAANSAANNATGIGAFSSAGFSNSTALGYQASTTAANTIQLGADGVTVVGSTAITNVKTSGTLTAGAVTYPNTHGTSGQVLSTTGSGTLTWTTAASGSGGTAHTVGEVYGGGIVFYITTGGYHGLIAETYNYGNATPEQGSDIATNPNFHSSNGVLFTDWRLPTYYELSLLYTARNTTGLNMSNGVYVSSTYIWSEGYPYKCLNFSNGSASQSGGNWNPQNVRAIRSF